MSNLPSWLLSIFLGLVLSLPWGMAAWLKWQHMKDNTILPTGSLTAKHGGSLGYFLNAICIGVGLSFMAEIKLWLILSGVISFFIGGLLATLLERKIYCNRQQLEIIIGAAQEYERLSDSNVAAEVMAQVAPKWWLKLMPVTWQQELRKKLQPILLPNESGEEESSYRDRDTHR